MGNMPKDYLTNITKSFANVVISVEDIRYLNWKVILILYLVTRLSIILLLSYASWNGQSMLCYTADCKHYLNNANYIVNGLNPYKVWKDKGSYDLPLTERADNSPLTYALTSTFYWVWRDIWAILLVFFIFDFLNLCLIYNLSRFKKISSLLYIFAPSIIRGLIFVEDELFVTFILASIYFFNRRKYSLSTVMLAISANVKFFPIVLFPILLLCMGLFCREKKLIPNVIKYSSVAKHIFIFILVSILSHLFFYPDWDIYYRYRTINYTLLLNGGLWQILNVSPAEYYLPLLSLAFILFYLFVYIKNLDIKTGYLTGSLIFLSLYPHPSFDHFIFLLPLFLVWAQWSKAEIIFWIFFTFGVIIEFLGLPTIGIISPVERQFIGVSILIGFYLLIANYLKVRTQEGI